MPTWESASGQQVSPAGTGPLKELLAWEDILLGLWMEDEGLAPRQGQWVSHRAGGGGGTSLLCLQPGEMQDRCTVDGSPAAPPRLPLEGRSGGPAAKEGGWWPADPLATRLNRPKQGSFPLSISFLLSMEGLLRAATMTLIKFLEFL